MMAKNQKVISISKNNLKDAIQNQIAFMEEIKGFLPDLEKVGALGGFPTSGDALAKEMSKHADSDIQALKKTLRGLK